MNEITQVDYDTLIGKKTPGLDPSFPKMYHTKNQVSSDSNLLLAETGNST
jgi:hypothetical protein